MQCPAAKQSNRTTPKLTFPLIQTGAQMIELRLQVKIGAKIVRHGRYVIFQMAEVAVPRDLFQEILRLMRSHALVK